VVLGEDHLDGSATVLLDPDGILGPTQREQAYREILRGKWAIDERELDIVLIARLVGLHVAQTSE
jgi:hypothetical protein